ncbi:MAG TPA: phage holin, LLH family [Candidatus Dojkabacteria bacterium]|nr:phage holin, LLH family [Candidatus Dojkabacteria bacterium]
MEVFAEYGWVFLQGLLNYLVPLLAAQAAVLLGAWIVKMVNEVKAKLTADQLTVLTTAVDIAIKAAEQMKIKDALIDKKTEALKIAQKYLTDHKVKIDVITLEAAIEAAVYSAFNTGK